VLAGIAVEDRKVWPLIRDLSDAQQHIFGMRLFEAYGREAKAQKLLDRKTFKHAAQLGPFEHAQRTQLARELLIDGTAVTRDRLPPPGGLLASYSIMVAVKMRGVSRLSHINGGNSGRASLTTVGIIGPGSFIGRSCALRYPNFAWGRNAPGSKASTAPQATRA
jgi:hypothetical protein